MKRTFLFLALLINLCAYSQTVELAKLSSGKFVDYTMLWDNEKRDIYGYFYIFEKDETSKNVTQCEYVLLDKNLNKVSNGSFEVKKLSFGLLGMQKPQSYTPIYKNGYILIEMVYMVNSGKWRVPAATRCRLLDLKKNELSEEYTLEQDLTKTYNPDKIDTKQNIPFGYYLVTPLKTIKELGYYRVNSNLGMNIEKSKQTFYYVNEKMENQWSYTYNNEKIDSKQYNKITFADYYSFNNKNILAARKNFVGKKNETLIWKGVQPIANYLFFDKNNGKLLTEISPFALKTKKEAVKEVENQKIFIDEKKMSATFINLTMRTKEVFLNEKKITGFSRSEYSLTDGKLQQQHFFQWNQLAKYLDINEYGFVKEQDDPDCYLYLHNVIFKENGNTLFVFEEYKPTGWGDFSGVKVNDMMIAELDTEMKVVNFRKIEKEKKTIRNGLIMNGTWTDRYGYFDYAGYQDLGNNDFLFFYYNKQKPEDGGKKQWIFGIVSYTNGQFAEQKLTLKSEDGSDMVITSAKKGYIMVYETFKDKKKSAEVRLEKINY